MALRRAGRTWEVLGISMNPPKAELSETKRRPPTQMLIRLEVTSTIFLTFFAKDK